MNAPLALVARKFRDHDVAAVRFEGELLFVVSEVADAIGISQMPRQITRWENSGHLRPDTHYRKLDNGRLVAFKAVSSNYLPNWKVVDDRTRHLLVLTERGLYRVLQLASTPVAIAFQDWLEEEVLPSINATGGYQAVPQITALPDPIDVPGARLLMSASTTALRSGDTATAAACMQRACAVLGLDIPLPTLKAPVTQAQKRTAVAEQLDKNPDASDREIARAAGVSHTFVARMRLGGETSVDEAIELLTARRDAGNLAIAALMAQQRKG